MGKVARFFGGVGKVARATKDATTTVVSAGASATKSSFESTSGVSMKAPDPVSIIAGTAKVTGIVVGTSAGVVAKAAIVTGREAKGSAKALVAGYKHGDRDPEINRIIDSL